MVFWQVFELSPFHFRESRSRFRWDAVMRCLLVGVRQRDHLRVTIGSAQERQSGRKLVGREGGRHGDRRHIHEKGIQYRRSTTTTTTTTTPLATISRRTAHEPRRRAL